MKCSCLLLLLMLFAKLSFGQSDTLYQYLDYNEHICKDLDTFYIRMAVKKPGLWLVKEYYASEGTLKMAGLFSDDSFKTGQGVFRYYYKNGRLEKEGHFADGKKHGLWMGYDEKGNTADSSLFSEGMPYLFSYHWDDKNLIFKGVYDSLGKGSGVETTYYNYDSNKISAYGIYSDGYKRQGYWNYYYLSGQKSCKGHFVNDSLVSLECYKEDGNLETYICEERVMPKPLYDMYQFLNQNINFPPSVRDHVPSGFSATVVVQFIVNQKGYLENIEVFRHTLPALDNEAVRVVKLMPRWAPGKEYNRPVKVLFRIPIGFKIEKN